MLVSETFWDQDFHFFDRVDYLRSRWRFSISKILGELFNFFREPTFSFADLTFLDHSLSFLKDKALFEDRGQDKGFSRLRFKFSIDNPSKKIKIKEFRLSTFHFLKIAFYLFRGAFFKLTIKKSLKPPLLQKIKPHFLANRIFYFFAFSLSI